MNKPNGLIDRIKLGLSIAWLVVLTGCCGYVGGGPDVAVEAKTRRAAR